MSQQNVEIVLRGVAAMNRVDPDAFNALCDARFEMRLVGVVGEPVRYVGADGVLQFFRDMSESWADWGFEVEEARDLDEHVLITGRQRGRGRVSGVEVDSPRACVVAVRNGAVTELRYFIDPADALKAVGLQE
ncbi:MAG TPA: nuclear transport factor 2 family protein [Solirubrobacteraceae bacterium]|nr:nuclear transport factor 2 family protein [Solirubrobacteraceae bacterium]